jgi:hypothetical protein
VRQQRRRRRVALLRARAQQHAGEDRAEEEDPRRPSPMPVPALDDEQVVCSMRDWGLRRRR